MGIDPVSLAVMAGGQALSFIGSGISARDGAKNSARQAAARNAVLQAQREKLLKFRDTNYQNFDKTMGGYAPAVQQAQQAALTQRGTDSANAAITAGQGNVGAAPVAASSTPGVSGDFATRMGKAIQTSRDTAGAGARLQGFDDNWVENRFANDDLARNLDLTNNYARGTAALTGPLQDFAQFAAYKAPSMTGQLLSAVGGLASSYGASGLKSLAAAGAAPTGAATTGAGASPLSAGLFGTLGGSNSAVPRMAQVVPTAPLVLGGYGSTSFKPTMTGY